ncbi:capsule biosynthesis protein CapD [Actinophytocola xinjiangensis]|uniref:Capsule biosynthesis protein CapD n=1 Tax=Actinophytocola xinjiangensis TaxID=485602 RepID=A0A7Z1AX69_9PSEU|nr:NAD(P)H-binding protein [Actinophytocola xinjiangensis]OLF07826.1 capsule biosynthesis protein CapD [Actinophytocola xinjiangensis]
MILVTGATGRIGSALLTGLRGYPVRALTRDLANATFPAGVDAVEGDLADDPAPLLKGVRALFLLRGLAPEAPVIDAAREAGVEHVVLVSSITVQTHPHLPEAHANLVAENLVKDSGLTWTILRPTQFASNTLLWSGSIRDDSTVRAPYPDVGLPAIHPADIAAVAREALTDSVHNGQTYALTGPAPVTPREQAAALAAALGRPLSFVELTREQAHHDLAPYFGPATAAVLDLMGGDTTEALRTVHDTVERITGHPATPFVRWATENVAAFR